MNKTTISRTTGTLLIFLLVIFALRTQWAYSLKPFLSQRRTIAYMSDLPDIQKLALLGPQYFQVIERVSRYPKDARIYFAPSFPSSKGLDLNWWYLYLLTRYHVYPRKLLAHDIMFYDGDKTKFLTNVMQNAWTYDEIDWIKTRGISQIMMIRNGQLVIKPVDSSLEDL